MRSAWGSGKPLVSEHKIYVVRKESSENKQKKRMKMLVVSKYKKDLYLPGQS